MNKCPICGKEYSHRGICCSNECEKQFFEHKRTSNLRQWYLVSYAYHRQDGSVRFCYNISCDLIALVNRFNKCEDGPYVIVNTIPIDEETAMKWDGNLKGT